jgi:hypothetical protein
MPSPRSLGRKLLIALAVVGGCVTTPPQPAVSVDERSPPMSECTITLPPGSSIAEHLDAGGVICLQAGVYPGGLFIERSVEIRGVPGSVIDAGGRGAAVRVAVDDVVAVVAGVELRGGHGELGAGVRLDAYADLTLSNCTITGNRPTQGGAAVGASRGTLRVEGGKIEGGVLLTGAVEAVVSEANTSGGARIREGARVTWSGGAIDGVVSVAGTTTRAPRLVLLATKLSEPVENDEALPGEVVGP